jgi:hypothetical protein|tara:strand:- start:256 stop:513 length:258 start_codon:yes stop_codon:yes gene_type:complete
MSHPGNDQIIDAMRDKMPNLTPDQIGRLVYLIDAYGRHQHTLGQLNMINTSDRSSAFDKLRVEYTQHSKDTREEITEIIEILFDY